MGALPPAPLNKGGVLAGGIGSSEMKLEIKLAVLLLLADNQD